MLVCLVLLRNCHKPVWRAQTPPAPPRTTPPPAPAHKPTQVRGKYAHHQHTNKAALNKVPAGHPYKPYPRFPLRQDALHTILQWLYGRIPYTLGQEPLPGEGHWTASAAAMKGGKAAQWHVYA